MFRRFAICRFPVNYLQLREFSSRDNDLFLLLWIRLFNGMVFSFQSCGRAGLYFNMKVNTNIWWWYNMYVYTRWCLYCGVRLVMRSALVASGFRTSAWTIWMRSWSESYMVQLRRLDLGRSYLNWYFTSCIHTLHSLQQLWQSDVSHGTNRSNSIRCVKRMFMLDHSLFMLIFLSDKSAA